MNNKPVGYIPNIALPTLTEEKHWVVINATKFDESDIPLYTHQYERPHNTVLVPCDKLAEMQAEIKALKEQLARADKVYDFDNPLLDKVQHDND